MIDTFVINNSVFFNAEDLDNSDGMKLLHGDSGKYLHLNFTAQQFVKYLNDPSIEVSGAEFFAEKLNIELSDAKELFEQTSQYLIERNIVQRCSR